MLDRIKNSTIGQSLINAGRDTRKHALFFTNDESFNVVGHLFDKRPRLAPVVSVGTNILAYLSDVGHYVKNGNDIKANYIGAAYAVADPCVARIFNSIKSHYANLTPPELKRNRMIAALILGGAAIASGKIIKDNYQSEKYKSANADKLKFTLIETPNIGLKRPKNSSRSKRNSTEISGTFKVSKD